MKEYALRAVNYTLANRKQIERVVDFIFSYAMYLAMAIFGAMWSLMTIGVSAEDAVLIINHDIYALALFTAVFLMLTFGFGKLVEYIGKL